MFLRITRARYLCLAVAIWLLGLGSAQANVLQDISYSSLPGNRVEIILTTAEPVVDPKSFTTDNPARIAIDLPNTSSAQCLPCLI